MLKKLLLLLVICATAAVAQPPIPKNPEDPTVTAHPAVGESNRHRALLPIAVRLKNPGKEREFTVRLRQNGTDLTEPLTVHTPARAERQLMLACPSFQGWGDQIEVVVEYRGKPVSDATAQVRHVNDKDMVIALLTPGQTSDFRYLGGYNDLLPGGANGGAQVVLNSPDLRYLPSHWSGLLGLDIIVVHDLPRMNLPQPVLSALASWTRGGGTLVLVSAQDPGEYAGTPLASLLPLEPSGTRDAGGATLLVGQPKRGSVVQSHANLPLLVQARQGAGQVYLVTAAVGSNALLGEKPTRDLWADIFKHKDPGLDPRFGLEDVNLLRKLPEMRLPSPAWLAWLLLLYVLVVGPINFALLRKRDRMLYIFLTVPLLAGVFTLGTFLATSFSRGTRTTVRELGRVELVSGQPGAVLDCAMTIFSPVGRSYDVQFPASTAALLQVNVGPVESQPPVVLSDLLTYPILKMEMSSLRRVAVRSLPALAGGIALKRVGPSSVLIDNQTGLRLKRCSVALDGKFSEPFELSAGRATVPLQMSTEVDPARAARHLIQPAPNDPIAEDQVTLQTRAFSRFSGNPSSEPALTGWSEEPQSGIKLDGGFRHLRTYLVVVSPP